MKKIVASAAVICLLFTGIFSYFQIRAKSESEDPGKNDLQTAYQQALEKLPQADFAAMYAEHDPDEIVATDADREITWTEFFHFYYSYISQISEYMATMSVYYGEAPSWDDVYDSENGLTFMELPAYSAREDILQYVAIEKFAAENGIEPSGDTEAAVDQAISENAQTYCGDTADSAAFSGFLSKNYLTEDLYRNLVGSSYLYQQMFTDIYGENGSRVSDETAVGYLEENGYLSANHILLMTRDMTNGENADEDTVRQKEEKAAGIAAELQAIEDRDARVRRFMELKEEYDEDTGRLYYPDGYTFTSGTMVTEFEKAVQELGDYEVSDPVESAYGYHVIMRLPLSGDALIEFSNGGSPLTARTKFANADYGGKLQDCLDSLKFEYAPGFAPELIFS